MMRLLILLALCLPGANAFGSPGVLEHARSTVGEWVAAEKAISGEELDWEEEKVLLNDLIAVATARIERLEAELAETTKVKSAADEKRAQLLEREGALAEKAETIRTFLAGMEVALRDLQTRLPDPLLEELARLYQRLPADPDETTLGLGERMQTVTAILGGVQQFDGKITVSETTRELPGENGKGSFRTLWLGLGQAYYLAPSDAGFGTPGVEGWEWYSRPELADRIREAIAIAEKTATEPKLIDLPVKLEEEK